MMTIYKYDVEVTDDFSIDLPSPHQILDVQVQNGKPFIWVLHDTDNVVRPTRFCIIGTGNPIERNMGNYSFVGTFQQGPFVWHLFKYQL